jgi:hypothetical protein
MNFIYEPYFLSFVVALICTAIYYLIQRNKEMERSLEDIPKKKKDLSPELKSILVFILSFSIFTGLFYAIKNYIFPKGDIILSESVDVPSFFETDPVVENTTSLFEKVQTLLPSMTLTIPTLFEQKHEENNEEERKRERREDRREKRQIDETLIAGKKKSPIKDKENLRFMNSKDARFADNDIDFDLKAFDLKGY